MMLEFINSLLLMQDLAYSFYALQLSNKTTKRHLSLSSLEADSYLYVLGSRNFAVADVVVRNNL